MVGRTVPRAGGTAAAQSRMRRTKAGPQHSFHFPLRPTQVDFGIRATPTPIWAVSDESSRVFGSISHTTYTTLGLGMFAYRIYIAGSFCPNGLDRLAEPTRPSPRRESTQNVARIPKPTWVGLHPQTTHDIPLNASLMLKLS